MPETDSQPKKSPTLTFLAGIAGFLLFTGITIFVFCKIKHENHPPDYETSRAEVRSKNLTELREAVGPVRGAYGWVDKEKGIVRLPVQRSMEVVLPELQANKPHASGVKVPPPVAPAPAATPVAAPDAGKVEPSAPTAPAAVPSPTPTPAKANPAPAATTADEPGSLFPGQPSVPASAPAKPEVTVP